MPRRKTTLNPPKIPGGKADLTHTDHAAHRVDGAACKGAEDARFTALADIVDATQRPVVPGGRGISAGKQQHD